MNSIHCLHKSKEICFGEKNGENEFSLHMYIIHAEEIKNELKKIFQNTEEQNALNKKYMESTAKEKIF